MAFEKPKAIAMLSMLIDRGVFLSNIPSEARMGRNAYGESYVSGYVAKHPADSSAYAEWDMQCENLARALGKCGQHWLEKLNFSTYSNGDFHPKRKLGILKAMKEAIEHDMLPEIEDDKPQPQAANNLHFHGPAYGVQAGSHGSTQNLSIDITEQLKAVNDIRQAVAQSDDLDADDKDDVQHDLDRIVGILKKEPSAKRTAKINEKLTALEKITNIATKLKPLTDTLAKLLMGG